MRYTAGPRLERSLSDALYGPMPRVTRTLVVVTFARLLLGALGQVVSPSAYGIVQLLLAAEFAAVGSFLLFATPTEAAGRSFGILLVLAAAPWPGASMVTLNATFDMGAAFGVFRSVRPEAFIPFFAWRFALEYPRREAPPWFARLLDGGLKASAVLSTLLFLGGLAEALAPGGTVAAWLAPEAWTSIYWPLLLVTSATAFVALAGKMVGRTSTERRRARILVYGFALAIIPFTLQVTLRRVVPAYAEMDRSSTLNLLTGWSVLTSLALAPLISAYSVLVEQALALRVLISGVVRLGVARGALVMLRVLPITLAATYLYWIRSEPPQTIVRRPDLVIGALLVAGTWWMCVRLSRSLQHSVLPWPTGADYQPAHAVSTLARASRAASDLEELQVALYDTLEPAVRVDACHLLLIGDDGRYGAPSGSVRPLPIDSMLPALIERADDAVNVFAVMTTLGRDDEMWLTDSGVVTFAPIKRSDGQLMGLLGLGQSRLDLPLSRDDLTLVTASCQVLAPAIERLRFPSSPRERSVFGDVAEAAECERCGNVESSTATICACGGALRPSLPATLAGRYRLVRRLGAGASAVTYLAIDMELDRQVAIKALPPVNLRSVALFRHEARVMASLDHAALATLYGTEFWQGRPLLLMEYLPGGTLGQRLSRGPLSSDEWWRLAMSVIDGVQYLHGRNVTHGDIAPRNIAYSATQVPKLIDFGLAHASATRALGAADAVRKDTEDVLHLLRTTLPAGGTGVPDLQADSDLDSVRERLRLVPLKASSIQ